MRLAHIRFVPTSFAPRRWASLRCAMWRSAPLRLAALRSAPCRSAPLKFAPRRSTPRRSALRRSAPARAAARRFVPLKLAPARSASDRFAPTRFVWRKSAWPRSSGTSGCSSRHSRIASAPCLTSSTCSGYAITDAPGPGNLLRPFRRIPVGGCPVVHVFPSGQSPGACPKPAVYRQRTKSTTDKVAGASEICPAHEPAA